MSEPQETEANVSNLSHPALTETDLKHHSQELGMLGKVFGSPEHAPMNIAGIVIIVCIVGMILTAFLPANGSATPGDMLKLFGSIALAALTFLGGYLGGRSRR